jgi:acyl carrier protein
VKAMVGFVEDEFGVHMSPSEMSEENLGSLRAVARFVASKQPFAVG